MTIGKESLRRSYILHSCRWEDSNDDCNVLASLTCDQTYQGTPDLICQCAPRPPPPVIWIQNQEGLCLLAKDGAPQNIACGWLAGWLAGSVAGWLVGWLVAGEFLIPTFTNGKHFRWSCRPGASRTSMSVELL